MRAAFISLLFLTLGGKTLQAEESWEPAVSAKEAVELNTLMQLAESDAAAAIQQLEQGERGPVFEFLLANLYFQKDQLPQAEARYRSAIKRFPQYRDALHNLARLQLQTDRPKEAGQSARRLLAIGDRSSTPYRILGHAALQEEQFVSADQAFRQVLLLEPGDADAQLSLIKCLIAQGRFPEANSLSSEVLRAKPDHRELWSLRAHLFLSMDQAHNAIKTIETAKRLNCAAPDLLATLGDLYINRSQAREATAAYRSAFAKQPPTQARRLRAAEGFLLIDQPEAAEAFLGDATDGDEKTLTLRARLAVLQMQPERAEKILTQLLAKHPLNGDALLQLGQLYARRNALEEAAMQYERAARISGFEARARILHAQSEVIRARYARAVELLETAQTFDDDPRVARYLDQLRRLVN